MPAAWRTACGAWTTTIVLSHPARRHAAAVSPPEVRRKASDSLPQIMALMNMSNRNWLIRRSASICRSCSPFSGASIMRALFKSVAPRATATRACSEHRESGTYRSRAVRVAWADRLSIAMPNAAVATVSNATASIAPASFQRMLRLRSMAQSSILMAVRSHTALITPTACLVSGSITGA